MLDLSILNQIYLEYINKMNLISRCLNLLPNSSKKKIDKILVIQLFKFILEMVGIGIIIPVIYLLAKGGEEVGKIIIKYEFLNTKIYSISKISSKYL